MEKLTQHIREQIQVVAPQEAELNGDLDADTWFTNPDSPLYQDMQELLKKQNDGTLKFHSYEEVFGERI